jgi:pyruvate dehydrogenase E1 component alpha subunit
MGVEFTSAHINQAGAAVSEDTVTCFQQPMDNQSLINLYRQMALIRQFEDKSAEMYTKAKIAGFLHLTNGQEAIAVGAMSALNPDDDLFTHYRDHGYAILKGATPGEVMAELYGRSGGTTGGRGGSMHLLHMPTNYWGGYAIVGGHLTLAAGVAVANQHFKNGRVTLCVMGDGSTNIGTFHATMNWAQLWKLPVIFLVENNQFAMGTPIAHHSSFTEIYRKADGYGMAAEQVDGNDVLAVREVICRAAERARTGQGPTLVEALTYRHRGHSMADPDVQRDKADIADWKKRDPLIRFANEVLFKRGICSPTDLEEIQAEADKQVEAAVEFAENSPEPGLDTLYNHIYQEPVSNMQIGGSLIRPAQLGPKMPPDVNGAHN